MPEPTRREPDPTMADSTEGDSTEGEPTPFSPSPPSIAEWGLSSAAAVVERMLEFGRAGTSGLRLTFPVNGASPAVGPDAGTDGGADADGTDSADAAGGAAERARQARRFRSDAERLVELYADWTRMLVDGAASLAEQAAGTGPVGANVGEAAGEAPGGLVLGPASAGATTTATAWLHVLDGPAAAPARLHATTLVAHDGATVAGDAVSCTPAELDTAVARTSGEVRVTAVVPVGTPPATYHGHLLAAGLPEVVLPVRLEVVA